MKPKYDSVELKQYKNKVNSLPVLNGLIDTAFNDDKFESKLKSVITLKSLKIEIGIIAKSTDLTNYEFRKYKINYNS